MPYMMGGFPDHETSLAVAGRLSRRRRRPDRARHPLLRPARRRADDPRGGDRRARGRRQRRGRARDLRDGRRPGPGRADGLREHGARPRRRRGIRAPRRRGRRSRGDRPRPAARGGGGDPRGVHRRRPGAGAAGRADDPGRPAGPDLRRRPRLRLRRLDRRAPPASATSCPRRSPTWSPRPRPSPRFRSRSASGSAPPSRPAEVGRIADGVIIGSRLVRAAGEAGSPQAAAEAVAEFLRETRVAPRRRIPGLH